MELESRPAEQLETRLTSGPSVICERANERPAQDARDSVWRRICKGGNVQIQHLRYTVRNELLIGARMHA